MNEEITEKTQTLAPFTKLCMTIGQLPSSYFESMSYYEQLIWFTKYLQEQVIPAVNQNAAAVEELQDLYIELQDYVNNYFENLDVQEEINNKLDSMALSGELTALIKAYVDPIYSAYETRINSEVETLNTKVNNAVSGSPLVASSTAGMTETDRVYVNTTDGKWYYYDGDTWEIGGTYQSTGVENLSITPYKTTFFKTTNNLLIPELCVLGAQINGTTGELGSNANYFVTDFIEITPGENYIMFGKTGSYFGNVNIGLYTENKTFISKVSSIYSNNITTNEATAKYMRVECRVVAVDTSYDISQWDIAQIDTAALSGRKWEYYASFKKELYQQPKNVKTKLIQSMNTTGQGGCIMDNMYINLNRADHTFTILNLDNLNAYKYYIDDQIALNHANDLTYNPNTEKIICADIISNALLEFNKDFSFNRSISISASPAVTISGIAYDEINNVYWGYTEDNNFIELDSSFNVITQVPFSIVGTKQGMTIYEDKLLLSRNDSSYSYINYYDTDGELIETQQLPIPPEQAAFEIEGLAIYGDMIIYNGLSSNKTYWYVTDNKGTTLFNNFVSLLHFIIN